MSIMSLGRGNGNGNGKSSKRVEPTPAPYPPRPVIVNKPEAEQLQLGNVTLEAVDRLTGMTADEIERVAEQVLDGAEETAAVLRELARRVRENGMFANERLARFVRVANQCADIARSMQQSVERRDEQSPPEPKNAAARSEHGLGVAEIDDAPGSARSSNRSRKRPRASGNGSPHDAGGPVWSAPVGLWRVLVDYAGLAAEVSAAIVIGLLIMVLVLMLNPSIQAVAPGPV